ncbi:DUF5615 family PIN-like protein [Nostoc spongiaeforme FACHB-130]|uniref:DUF5615 family PIN-like protein n=1 Tax=Nostoc spongiaeforme FACHB-130 TaxID=1357510 RepID=A0ABR8G3T0_9NOSO|nr:DUF5615 family PIN-like protein [Nostoc spongiaeforme]MBD2597867.1 DUF5615 family PIN-like protein [Nostoc spongiaeforme FACHB-130]
MKIWLDAQLPPALASWITNTFAIEVLSLRDIGLRDAKDIDIFEAARIAPQILWLTCGNVTNRNLRQILTITLPDALEKLRQGEIIVEISNSQ